MTRFLLVLAAALVAAPAALADGIAPFATQGGPGVPTADGSARFVALSAGAETTVVKIDNHGGGVVDSAQITGVWGVPVATYGSDAEGLSHDGKTLVLGDVVHSWPHSRSSFALLDPKTLRVRRTIVLHGDFAFDALSPDATTLYLIQHTNEADTTRYVVRAVDTRTGRLLPGRIADRTQRSWVMEGYPLNRVTSQDGRWVYTLYGNTRNVPFIHALDTVRGVAHCIGLPLRAGDQTNLVVGLRNDDRTLAVHWLSGRRWLTVDTRTWRLSPDRGGGFPWWTLSFVVLLALPLRLLRRDRAPGADEVVQDAAGTGRRRPRHRRVDRHGGDGGAARAERGRQVDDARHAARAPAAGRRHGQRLRRASG
jgi:hypothetical protein